MEKGRIRKYGLRLTVLMLVGVLAVLLSMNRSEAASSRVVNDYDELIQAFADGVEEISLGKDIYAPGGFEITGNISRRLDLNGHKLNINSNDLPRGYIVLRDGSLTICDSSSDESGEIGGGFNLGGFGGCIQVNGAKLTLESGTITSSNARYGGGVAVIRGGSFNMTGGAIQKCQIQAPSLLGYGGGVFVCDEGSTFTMSGGTIRANQEFTAAKGRGGGVAVMSGATFTMTGGCIGDHTVTGGANSISGDGAGVYVKGSTFDFLGGSVENNYTTKDGAGIYLDEGASFKMASPAEMYFNVASSGSSAGGALYIKNADCTISGGSIYQNSVGGESGGAIYIDPAQTKTVSITDTLIEENNSGENAGGIYVGGGGLGLNNVTLNNNSSYTKNGGGIYVDNSAVLIVTGGSFTGNTAVGGEAGSSTGLGGAIYQTGKSSVKLSGVKFTGNEANDGGAIYVGKEASCTIVDGKIADNKARSLNDNSNYVGGGIKADGTLTLGGAAVISGNGHYDKSGESLVRSSNVLLAGSSFIDFTTPLQKGAEIGVWKEGNYKRITKEYGRKDFEQWRDRPSTYFFSDDAAYFAAKEPSLEMDDDFFHEVFLINPDHKHELSVGNVVPATCVSGGQMTYYECSGCHHLFAESNGDREIDKSEVALSVDPNRHVGRKVETNVTKDPTCTENGEITVTVKCTACGKVLSENKREITALGHDFIPIYKDEDGNDGYGLKCRICGLSWFEKGAIPECNHEKYHKSGDGIEPKCLEGGRAEYFICEECGRHFLISENEGVEGLGVMLPYTDVEKNSEMLFIQPLGHDPEMEEVAPDGTGGTDPLWFVDDTTVIEPTCTEGGSHDEVTRCKRCQEAINRITVEDPPLGHDLSEPYIKDCYLIRECSRCDYIEAVLSHNMFEVQAVDPTCTTQGHKDFYVCLACNHMFDHESYHDHEMSVETSYSEVLLDALGHDFGEWELVEEPAANREGLEMRVCSRCEAIETRNIKSDVKYTFTKGDGSEWTRNSTGTLDFTVKRSYKDEDTFDTWFTGTVLVDDKELSEGDFSAAKGSVELKLSDSFLNTLKVGEHTITVVFADADVSAKFKVVEPAEEATVVPAKDGGGSSIDNSSPKTGDDTPVVVFVILAAVSAAAIIVCVVMKKRKKADPNDRRDNDDNA